MQTKLTLRLDARLIQRAKRHAARTGKSVSAIVADYFAALGVGPGDRGELPVGVRSLHGALSGAGGDGDSYRRYLEQKHR